MPSLKQKFAILAHKPVLIAAISFAIPLVSVKSHAQEATTLQSLISCQNIGDPTARLECFDTHSATIGREIAQGELVPVYKQEISNARRGLFGIENVRLPIFLDKSEDEIREIQTTIVRASRIANNRWRFELEDGTIWEQIDTVDPHFQTRPGTPVRIRRAAMGSYLISIGRATPLRVTRRS